ncbi:MAG: TonB-dependent receptor plug domain-containing protein [Phycisphaeraceae bacterium]
MKSCVPCQSRRFGAGLIGHGVLALWLSTSALAPASAAIIDSSGPEPDLHNDYADLDLADLVSVEVTSVAGTAQDPFLTPAAISVLTPEEIHRSGHQHIADALSLVPGVHSARINAHEWAVTIRGFNDHFANKLQVLQDGRSLYDPIFAGVRWQNVDLVLDDIERIEVVRGPGATLWGANAVNGVINISTKSARDTQGLYVKQVAGTELRSITAGRYGGQLGERTWYRVWGKHREQDSFAFEGGEGFDDWSVTHFGARVDHDAGDGRDLTLEGAGFYSGRKGERLPLPDPDIPFATEGLVGDNRILGGHLLGELSDEDAAGGWRLLGYYDYYEHDVLEGAAENRHTLSAEWRHWLDWGDRHELIWGLGYRYDSYDIEPSRGLALDPKSRDLSLLSMFVQDTVTLSDDLFAMAGVKFERNDFTDWEIQPSARIWWTPSDEHMLWGAVSRAVRRPSPKDRDLNFTLAYTPPPPFGDPDGRIQLLGDVDDAEELLAFEAGHRFRPADSLTFDSAVFYNRYDKLVSTMQRGFDAVLVTGADAQSYGLETSLDWRPTSRLRLGANYSLLIMDFDSRFGRKEETSPTHQAQLQADLGLTDRTKLHTRVYYRDQYLDLPSHWRLDTGVTWQASENVDFAIWGRNLLDEEHLEFIGEATWPTEVQRSIYAQMRIRF